MGRTNFCSWELVTKTVGRFSYQEWRRPGSLIRIIQLGRLFRVLSPVRLAGMYEQPAITEEQTNPLFSKDFVTLEQAIAFADA